MTHLTYTDKNAFPIRITDKAEPQRKIDVLVKQPVLNPPLSIQLCVSLINIYTFMAFVTAYNVKICLMKMPELNNIIFHLNTFYIHGSVIPHHIDEN